jgi:hypothetical protein
MAELAKDGQRIDSGQSQDRQEVSKSNCQRQTRVKNTLSDDRAPEALAIQLPSY